MAIHRGSTRTRASVVEKAWFSEQPTKGRKAIALVRVRHKNMLVAGIASWSRSQPCKVQMRPLHKAAQWAKGSDISMRYKVFSVDVESTIVFHDDCGMKESGAVDVAHQIFKGQI